VTDTMKAAIIHAYGSPDVLQVTSVPRPTVGAGELLIRVHCAGINPVDCKTRAGGGVAGRLPDFHSSWAGTFRGSSRLLVLALAASTSETKCSGWCGFHKPAAPTPST